MFAWLAVGSFYTHLPLWCRTSHSNPGSWTWVATPGCWRADFEDTLHPDRPDSWQRAGRPSCNDQQGLLTSLSAFAPKKQQQQQQPYHQTSKQSEISLIFYFTASSKIYRSALQTNSNIHGLAMDKTHSSYNLYAALLRMKCFPYSLFSPNSSLENT